MKRSYGFTVIEVIAVVLFLAVASTLLFIQKDNLAATQRDTQRKVAINAMYYNLENVYYKQHGYYPSKIDSKTLTAMDPSLFTDPDGNAMNDSGAEYHYNPLNCTSDQCKSYSLSAD